MATPDLRINARLTGEDAQRFRELQKREGLSASDLLRNALRAYHVARARPRVHARTPLDASGFIGGGEAPPDLSTRYKDYLTDTLEHKLPLRVQDGDLPRGRRK